MQHDQQPPPTALDPGAGTGTDRCSFACYCCCCSLGLFMASQTTGEALKGGRLVAEVMAREGYKVVPGPG